jgi:hypothetical protein
MGESDLVGQTGDEWLYQLGKNAAAHPFRLLNGAMRDVMEGAAQRKGDAAAAAAAPDADLVAAFVVALQRPTAAERLEPAFSGAGAAALLAFIDMQRPVAEYAAQRTLAMLLCE